MDKFDKTKADILADLGVVDYSPKGSIDSSILPVIALVNAQPDLVTTSSCAGRVSVFVEGDKSGKHKIGGKGEGGHWLFTTHSADGLVPQWRCGLDAYRTVEPVDALAPRRYVLYKFEPFILHIKCRDFEAARQLFSVALFCGFRESGIGSNNNVAIRTSMRIDAPLGFLDGDKIHRLASDEYIAELDELARELFAKNTQRIEAFAEQIKQFAVSRPQHVATREEKAQRDRELGLRRQEQLHEDREREISEELGYTLEPTSSLDQPGYSLDPLDSSDDSD